MVGLTASLLGKFEVRLADQPALTFRSRSVQALFALLATEAETTGNLRREWLIEVIWPEISPKAGRKKMRQTLYELRKLIPAVPGRNDGSQLPFVLADRQHIGLNADCDYAVDVLTFMGQVQRADMDSLRVATELYQGEFLSDLYLPDSNAFEEWVAAKRALLRRLALEALEKVAEQALQQQEFAQAEKSAWRQLEIDSLREKALQQLMVALVLSGRRSMALEQYEKSRLELKQELGVEPAAETKAIFEHIQSGDLFDSQAVNLERLRQKDEETELTGLTSVIISPGKRVGEGVSPELARAEAIYHNLPSEPTPFVGRQKELQELRQRLLDPGNRLLTLLGPGGSGKTRLALRMAYELIADALDHFKDGIYLLSIAQAADDESLVAGLADILEFRAHDPGAELKPQLIAYLKRREMLVILDNAEYIAQPEGFQLLVEILAQAPGVKMLACSRVRLNIRSERLFPIGGLMVPQSEPETQDMMTVEEAKQYTAVQLFHNSAERLRPDYRLTKNDVAAVLDICRRLQGIPLAIELAASWIELLSTAEIAAEIKQDFDFLQSDWHDLPERQRSLRAVYDTSWRLLNAEERAAFLRLAVFRGGFNYEAARQVADVNLRTLLGLVNKSWLQRRGDGRYLPHEILRQYAYRRLADDQVTWQDAHDRYSDYFAAMMEVQWERLKGPKQLEANTVIEKEMENITYTWQWLAQEGKIGALVDRMLPGLFFFHAARSSGQRLVALVDEARGNLVKDDKMTIEPRHEATLITAAAVFPVEYSMVRYFIGEIVPATGEEKIRRAQHIVEENDLAMDLGIWSVLLAMLLGWVSNGREGVDWLRLLVGHHRQRGDPWLLAFALENLGGLLMPSGRGSLRGRAGLAETRRYLSEAVKLFEDLGDLRERGHSMRLLGLVSRGVDDREAKRMLLAARRLLQEAGDQVMAGNVGIQIAEICFLLGETDEAFLSYRQMRRYYAEMGNQRFEADALSKESMQAVRYSTIAHARGTREQSLALSREAGDLLGIAWSVWELGVVERVGGRLELARSYFEEAKSLFAELGDPNGLVFYHRGLGDIAQDLSQYEEAGARFEESLRLARQNSHMWATAYALAGLGRTTLGQDRDHMAQLFFLEGLELALEHGYRELVLVALAGLASHSLATGQTDRALQLAAFVLGQSLSWNETKQQARSVIEGVQGEFDGARIEVPEAKAQTMTLEEITDLAHSLLS